MNKIVPQHDLFVQCRVINGKKFLAKNNEVFELDEVSELVWDLIDGKTSLEQIVERISEKYHMDALIVMNDIRKFLKELQDKELIEG